MRRGARGAGTAMRRGMMMACDGGGALGCGEVRPSYAEWVGKCVAGCIGRWVGECVELGGTGSCRSGI